MREDDEDGLPVAGSATGFPAPGRTISRKPSLLRSATAAFPDDGFSIGIFLNGTTCFVARLELGSKRFQLPKRIDDGLAGLASTRSICPSPLRSAAVAYGEPSDGKKLWRRMSNDFPFPQ